MGANVIIVEVDPIRALEAAMDGFRVMTSLEAAEAGDLFITATGSLHVFGGEHFGRMRDGAILANAGHFNDEFDIPALEDLAAEQREVRPSTSEYRMVDGRRLYLLAEGGSSTWRRPRAIRAWSWTCRSRTRPWVSSGSASTMPELEPQVYEIPLDIDRAVARLKLASMGIAIDEPTAEQEAYAASWQQGT